MQWVWKMLWPAVVFVVVAIFFFIGLLHATPTTQDIVLSAGLIVCPILDS
jgi:hypothetical protein